MRGKLTVLALMAGGAVAAWSIGLPSPLPAVISVILVVMAYMLGQAHEETPQQMPSRAVIAAEIKEQLLEMPGTADYVKLAEQLAGMKATIATMARALQVMMTVITGGTVPEAAILACERQLSRESYPPQNA